MNASFYSACMRMCFDRWMLSAEAGTVMTLRMLRIATGRSAGTTEAELMVTEKARAAIELQTRLMTGAFDITPLGAAYGSVRHHLRKVTANRKRLSRG